jgi:hypothetical protein
MTELAAARTQKIPEGQPSGWQDSQAEAWPSGANGLPGEVLRGAYSGLPSTGTSMVK